MRATFRQEQQKNSRNVQGPHFQKNTLKDKLEALKTKDNPLLTYKSTVSSQALTLESPFCNQGSPEANRVAQQY
jgi:hypothetical protein